MTKRLDEHIGAMEYDGLIASNTPVADVVTVSLKSGSGILKRGTIIIGAPGGELASLSAAATIDKAIYIIADDVDTGEGVAVTATAYRTGHFASNKLITAEGYTLIATDTEILRKSGILISDAINY